MQASPPPEQLGRNGNASKSFHTIALFWGAHEPIKVMLQINLIVKKEISSRITQNTASRCCEYFYLVRCRIIF